MLATERAIRPPRWRPALYVAAWALGAPLLALFASAPGRGAALACAGIALLLVALTAAGALSVRSGLFARPINAVAGSPDVCLTFDDGPDPQSTPALLELLARRGQRATFFLIGARASQHPELVRRIAAAGHELAVHSMAHAWHLCFWSPRRLAADLRAASAAIAATGVQAAPLFRPPNGVLSPRIPLAVKRAGMHLVGYTRRAYDRAPGASPERCRARVIRGLRPGAIIALHDATPSATLALLPGLLDELERRGLRSVPLGEALAAG